MMIIIIIIIIIMLPFPAIRLVRIFYEGYRLFVHCLSYVYSSVIL